MMSEQSRNRLVGIKVQSLFFPLLQHTHTHTHTYIFKSLLELSGQQRCTAPGGSIKIRSPNFTANTNVESKKMRGWTTCDVNKEVYVSVFSVVVLDT